MIAEFQYRVRWRSERAHPGSHAGTQLGGGDQFFGYAPFVGHPDPRRIDGRTSATDPFGQLMVRMFRQRSSIPIYLLADLSASMGFGHPASKLSTIKAFADAAAYSAHRSGDPFGLYACDDEVRWDLHLPLRQYRGLPSELAAALDAFEPVARSSAGLRAAAGLLGRARSLVFVMSDFHFESAEVAALFDTLAHHDVVPLVVWQGAELSRLPRWGWATLLDPENGREKTLFMRPSLHAAFGERLRQRRSELMRLTAPLGRRPFFVDQSIDADALTEYFLDG